MPNVVPVSERCEKPVNRCVSDCHATSNATSIQMRYFFYLLNALAALDKIIKSVCVSACQSVSVSCSLSHKTS